MLRRIAVRMMVWILLVLAAAPAAAELFYVVNSPEGQRNWLLGTLHSGDPRLIDFPPVVERALIDAERMALELVPDERALAVLEAAMLLPEGEQLSDHLPAELATRAQQLLIKRGVAPERAARMQPWAAAMVVTQPVATTPEFMDLALARRASRSGAELVALETVQEQIEFFRQLEIDIHRRMLELAVEEPAQIDEQYRQLLELYLSRDLERLRQLALTQLQPLGEAAASRFIELGIEQRNQRMIERALPLLHRGGTLVAVGALHLPGPGGMIARLRAAGFEVDPIY